MAQTGEQTLRQGKQQTALEDRLHHRGSAGVRPCHVPVSGLGAVPLRYAGWSGRRSDAAGSDPHDQRAQVRGKGAASG